MKKRNILLASLIAVPLLVACSQSVYKPSYSYPGDPLKTNDAGGDDNPDGGDIDLSEPNMTVNFYLDYSHSDEPLYTMRWFMLKPLEKIPDEAKLTDAKAADPLYNKFLGYSEYSSSIGENLWDFEKDYKQSNVLNLYGIWVSAD